MLGNIYAQLYYVLNDVCLVIFEYIILLYVEEKRLFYAFIYCGNDFVVGINFRWYRCYVNQRMEREEAVKIHRVELWKRLSLWLHLILGREPECFWFFLFSFCFVDFGFCYRDFVSSMHVVFGKQCCLFSLFWFFLFRLCFVHALCVLQGLLFQHGFGIWQSDADDGSNVS